MKRLIVANWKMNGSLALVDELQSIQLPENVIVCPQACYLPLIKPFVISPGAQNCSQFDNGAFTGEISAAQLKELGCKYVIVGHSERRILFNETNSLINQKAYSAIHAELTPIICVGETYEERKENRFKQAILAQIDQVTHTLDVKKNIIAYEPIWSIGTGLIPTNEDIQEVLGIIRERIGTTTKIIYGGSVTDKNALSLSQIRNLNGVLVGGASLNIHTFQTIINAFQEE